MPVRTKRLAFDGLPPSPTPFHFYSLLTVRERRLVDAYVATLRLDRAARAAGVSDDKANEMLDDERLMCAVRERTEASSEMALLTAVDVRRHLKLILDADPAEVSGVHIVACRHCYGDNDQFQYTRAELYYLEQAHSYGELGWAFACVTDEFGRELHGHARAAWLAGKSGRAINLKGGDGYSRNSEVNPDCSQCHGRGTPMFYVTDSRSLSPAAKAIVRGYKVGGDRVETLTISRDVALQLAARDNNVGVERREIVVQMPRTPEELNSALESMPTAELEQFLQQVVTLGEGEYSEVDALLASRPERRKIGFVRRR